MLKNIGPKRFSSHLKDTLRCQCSVFRFHYAIHLSPLHKELFLLFEFTGLCESGSSRSGFVTGAE